MDSEQKTNDNDQEQVELDEFNPSYFSMLPNFVSSMPEVSHTALRLYIHYVKVCGHDKRRSCWMSVKTLAKQCFMDYKTIIKARKDLEDLDLITVKRQRQPNGSEKINVKINNPWKRNHEFYTDEEQSTDEQNPSGKQTIGAISSSPIGVGKTNNRGRENKQSGRLENEQPNNTNTNNNIRKNKTKRITHTGSGRSVHLGFAPLGKNEIKKEITYGDVVTDQLYHSLLKNRRITNKKTNIESWTSTINQFIKTSIITMEEFDEVLDWFIIHMKDRFVPKKICCAKSFCERFVDISDAMDRTNYTEKPKTQYEELMEKFEEKEMAGSI